MSSMRMLSQTKSQEAHMQSQHTHKKEKFSAKHVKSQSIPNLAFGQYFANKLADVRRLWRQGFSGGALIRMCCSYCVFLSALSSALPKTYKPGLQTWNKTMFQNSAAEIEQTCKSQTQQRLLHRSDWKLMVFFPMSIWYIQIFYRQHLPAPTRVVPMKQKEKLRHIESAYGALTAL